MSTGTAGIILVFYLILVIIGIVFFVFQVRFIVKVPSELDRIAKALERIAGKEDYFEE